MKEEEVKQQPCMEDVPLTSPPQVDKGKGIAMKDDEERPLRRVETGSFMVFA